MGSFDSLSRGAGSGLGFPIVDYHVHLSEDLTIEGAVELAERRKMRFGIVAHPGPDGGIQTDRDLEAYVDGLRAFPVYAGLQPMYVNWSADFTEDAIDRLDYVLMDADTMPQPDGGWLRIWRHDNFIPDMDAFVEAYMDHIVHILSEEPIDIFARPTYLPINFARHYDEIWTKERMRTIIELAKERDIALEISENVRVPSPEFVRLAKAAGTKFTFGTNARNDNAGNFTYCISVARECGLREGDMWGGREP
jgi:histidinol phosphatase-like PHP family hydrolase